MTKNFAISSAAFAFSLLSIGAAQAAPPHSLSECYDRVISHCNTTAHPQGCASGGMDECDKVFPKPLILDPKLPVFGAKVTVPPAKQITLQTR